MERLHKMFFKYVSSKLARRVVSAALIKPTRQLNLVDWYGHKLEGLITNYIPDSPMGHDHQCLANSTIYYDCLPSVAMHHNRRKPKVNLSTSVINSAATGKVEGGCKSKSVTQVPPKKTEPVPNPRNETRDVKALPYRLKFNIDQLGSFQATMQSAKRPKRIKLEPDSKGPKAPGAGEPKGFGCTAPNCPKKPGTKDKLAKASGDNLTAKEASILWIPVPRFAETLESLTEKKMLKSKMAAFASSIKNQIPNIDESRSTKSTTSSKDKILNRESEFSYFENACLYPEGCDQPPSKALKSDPQENNYTINTFMSMPNRFAQEDSTSDDNCIPERFLSMPYSHLSTDRRPCDNQLDSIVTSGAEDAAVACLQDPLMARNYLNAFGSNDTVDAFDELLTPLKVWSYPKEFISTFNVETKKSNQAAEDKKPSRYENYFRR